MAVQVVMPQLGESIVEGTVAKWLVREGDTVEKDQPLLEVSTDKVDTELPAPAAGVIGRILVNEGQTVDVGTVLAEIEPDARAAPAKGAAPDAGASKAEGRRKAGAPPRDTAKQAPPAPAPREPLPEPVPRPGAAPRPEPAPRLSRDLRAEQARQAAPPADRTPREETEGGERRRVSPLVRRMAEEHAIDLSQITGTGIDGRVTKNDVLAFLGRQSAPARAPVAVAPGEEGLHGEVREGERTPATMAPSTPPGHEGYVLIPKFPLPRYTPQPGDQEIPFTRIRKLIADHMMYSNVVSPRVTAVAEVNMGRVARIREERKAELKAEGVSLTYLPFIIAALARTIPEFPGINASVHDEKLILKKAIHVGVAVDTDRGLLVPVVHHADEKGVLDLARAVQDLGDRARTKALLPADMAGSTIAVTNPGAKGNLFGTPVINQPHVVIIRMGEVVKRPIVIEMDGEDVIAIRPMMYLALTYDHRVVDGVLGNGALHRMKEIIEAGDFDL
jgi:2-oxoglutarate dehydrogenase E2 component (dihydrolipoamide succinyltransferase)